MTATARRDLLERLQRQGPHPGEKAIYQPIDELPECASWKIVRSDSKARVELMAQVIEDVGLPAAVAPNPPTYLDIGCNTGYFCDRIRRLGFYTEVWTWSKAMSRLPKSWMLTSVRDTLATSSKTLLIISSRHKVASLMSRRRLRSFNG